MPRIAYYALGTAGQETDHQDYCRFCYRAAFAWAQKHADTTDVDVEHPPYSGDDYRCAACGRFLDDASN